ncbi:hypothetical protein [Caballeronia sp. LZ001]|uniref:hypothetical protein n=1 Tax=Caballeronia sp. LZ001 TaxID=3038553 RepID=UPI0028619ABD|nr:hypothetical protein [Caballeronia sp. LZ001]MDR5799392.1 hypothetical protein [Caballeronia sp. LZ001]
MNIRVISLCAMALMLRAVAASSAEAAPCGTLEGAAGSSFALREGESESVNLQRGDETIQGALHVYRDDAVCRVYWQPDGSPEQYVLANAGENCVRLVATPPRGSKVDAGPGTLPSQSVLSCPAS